jgi:hypothetical protein
MSPDPRASRTTYLGLLTVTMATVSYEVLLTRIFSVTLWYHFAFMAISVAMFGMTVGALAVYLRPGLFPRERLASRLALFAWLFAVAAVLALAFHVRWPEPLPVTYVAVAVPFAMSGVAVCLALTRFPEQVAGLYAADLVGAAAGCVLVIPLLAVTDGLTAAVAVAALASLGAVLFALGGATRRLIAASLATALVFGSFAAFHTVLVRRQQPWLHLLRAKGRPIYRPLYEKWNSFSRVTIEGDPDKPRAPIGWGMSSAWSGDRIVPQIYLILDAMAGTVLTRFDGDLAKLRYLGYDVTNAVHHLRTGAKVLVIGPGGGRDVLSALAMGQRSVTAVEINENVLSTVNGRFGEFTGHLDRDPRITFVNDEARSWVARTRERFDVIQVSLIDTWAATAAGAFVLSESSLYTVEAWKSFLGRLEPRGILTFSRWYFRQRPGEVYRLTSLASAALRASGIDEPRSHIAILRRMYGAEGADQPDGIGTILVGRSPFSDEDLGALERLAHDMRFELVLTPRFALDPVFERLASGRDLEAVVASLPINVAPPTDDSPFFFHMLRLRDMFRPERQSQGTVSFNMEAVHALGTLLITVVGLTLLCILVPLLLTADRSALRVGVPFFVYFAGIGLGFMMVEISQMQRLVIFLGHPTYSLSVVLFTLLLAGGIGSGSTSRFGASDRGARWTLAALLAVLVVFGFVTPRLVAAFAGATTPNRILVAVGVLFPLGLGMGTAFPLGMRRALRRTPALAPWLWGINGATSVCASVLAVAIALTVGISASYWTGAACYALAVSAGALAMRSAVETGGR